MKLVPADIDLKDSFLVLPFYVKVVANVTGLPGSRQVFRLYSRPGYKNMKIWSKEHIFDNPWELVARAQWRKYPNKFNQAVEGIDVVDRRIDEKGVLKTHRLLSTKWGIPGWATKVLGTSGLVYAREISVFDPITRYMHIRSCNIVGSDGIGHASEHSTVDPKNKTMELKTRNLTFCNMITIDETLVYSPHPEDKNKTCLKQEAVINVKGIPFGSYIESFVCDNISKNASKGREAMDHVINVIQMETRDLQLRAQQAMETINLNFEAMESNNLSFEV